MKTTIYIYICEENDWKTDTTLYTYVMESGSGYLANNDLVLGGGKFRQSCKPTFETRRPSLILKVV